MLRTQITQMATASGIENGTPMKPLVQPRPNVTDYATPAASVSAFCRAVLTHLLPKEFLGVGEDQKHNHTVLMNSVDRFLRLRRFESMTLHDVSQGLKVRRDAAVPRR